jgi:hypothetical protein
MSNVERPTSNLEQGRAASHPKPYTRHVLGIYSGVQRHPKAIIKPHQGQLLGNQLGTNCDPKATLKRHQSHTNATPMRPQSHLKARGKLGCIQTAPFLSHAASFNIRFGGVLAGGRGHRMPLAVSRAVGKPATPGPIERVTVPKRRGSDLLTRWTKRAPCSPSPRPSPQRRGCPAVRRWRCLRASIGRSAAHSLSPRERVGVRGKDTSELERGLRKRSSLIGAWRSQGFCSGRPTLAR